MTAGFVQEIQSRTRRVDVALLAVVPAMLVALSLVPRSGRVALAFHPGEPTLVAAYLSHFVHLTAAHLLSNLAGYLLFAPLVYLLCLLSGDRWLFRAGFATFLVAFPFALSGLEVALGGRVVLLGFSGINAALFGLLAFTLTRYVGTRVAGGTASHHAPPAFFLAAALIAAVAVPVSLRSVGVAAAALLAVVLFVGGRDDGLVRLLARVRVAARRPGYVELAAVGTVVFVGYPFLAFPQDVATAGAVVNLNAHLLGFALGFIVAHVTTLVSARTRTSTPPTGQPGAGDGVPA